MHEAVDTAVAQLHRGRKSSSEVVPGTAPDMTDGGTHALSLRPPGCSRAVRRRRAPSRKRRHGVDGRDGERLPLGLGMGSAGVDVQAEPGAAEVCGGRFSCGVEDCVAALGDVLGHQRGGAVRRGGTWRSTMRWWNVSDRSISAAPKVRNAWNTSGMSTVRASIVASRWWRAAARTPSWKRRLASWSRRTPSSSTSTLWHSAEALGRGDELAELGFGDALGRHLDGVGLETDTQAVEVDDLGRQRAHHGAPVALAHDEALGLEHAQRLAHRRARQAGLRGDALLDQALAGHVAVLDDGGPDLLVGVRGADGVGRRGHAGSGGQAERPALPGGSPPAARRGRLRGGHAIETRGRCRCRRRTPRARAPGPRAPGCRWRPARTGSHRAHPRCRRQRARPRGRRGLATPRPRVSWSGRRRSAPRRGHGLDVTRTVTSLGSRRADRIGEGDPGAPAASARSAAASTRRRDGAVVQAPEGGGQGDLQLRAGQDLGADGLHLPQPGVRSCARRCARCGRRTR